MFLCRTGAVSYLNTLPLVHGLVRGENRVHEGMTLDLDFDLPGRLADRLHTGKLDVALIPVLEVFRNPDYTIVSDACIGCRGPVWSVKLLSRVPLSQIGSLALDEGSRTSCALVQILLAQTESVQPHLAPLPMEADWRTVESDAVLIIGDRAMKPADPLVFPIQIDLGQWWFDTYRVPFVFAVWAARPRMSTSSYDLLETVLNTCRDFGTRHAARIAEIAAGRYELTRQQCLDYFQKHLYFQLGPSERVGMARFRELAAKLEFCPNDQELQFHGC